MEWCNAVAERFGLEGTLRIVQVDPPCPGQGRLPPSQVAQGSFQPALNTSRDGAAAISLGDVFQCLALPTLNYLILISNLNPLPV